jgi:hypothetical protein
MPPSASPTWLSLDVMVKYYDRFQQWMVLGRVLRSCVGAGVRALAAPPARGCRCLAVDIDLHPAILKSCTLVEYMMQCSLLLLSKVLD